MIKNERQYWTTKSMVERLQQMLSEFGDGDSEDSDIHPLIAKARQDATRSQLLELRADLKEYEDLKAGKFDWGELMIVISLPETLIKARIARGMTQRDLANRIGLKEQQVQRYEATEYAGASLSRIKDVVGGLWMDEVSLTSPNVLEPDTSGYETIRSHATILANMTADREALFQNLKAIRHRIDQYDYLQRSLHKTNVAEDSAYQYKFSDYYQIKRRASDWKTAYFAILEREKRNKDVSLSDVLARMHDGDLSSRVELSFCSKLVATIDPHRPPYDENVRMSLGLPRRQHKKQLDGRYREAMRIYDLLRNETERLIHLPCFLDLRDEFDRTFPSFAHFTDMKKLDLFLWRYGDILKKRRRR